jgi:hypothetical protein
MGCYCPALVIIPKAHQENPMKRTARLVCVALLLGVGFTASSSATHSWGGYHWARTSNPFVLKVGDNVGTAWDTYLNKAIADWNGPTVLSLAKVAGSSTHKNCRPSAGRIEVCADRYGNTGWLGIAQVWVSGKHITQATTKVNDTYFNTATYNKPEWRQMVMCQEIAHDFGLDHQDEAFNNANLGSCMDYTNNPLGPPSNTQPNAHDFNQIASIYAHVDETTTISSALPSSTPAGMRQNDFVAPAQWGRLVRSIGRGRAEVYELDFGRDNKVVTVVYWADPDADAQ